MKKEKIIHIDADGFPIKVGAVYHAVKYKQRTVMVVSLDGDDGGIEIQPLTDSVGGLVTPDILTLSYAYFGIHYAQMESIYSLLILV